MLVVRLLVMIRLVWLRILSHPAVMMRLLVRLLMVGSHLANPKRCCESSFLLLVVLLVVVLLLPMGSQDVAPAAAALPLSVEPEC